MDSLIIAPSILNADWAALGDTVHALERAGADWLHLDIMDGHFVPSMTFGPPMVAALKKRTGLVLDVHLMIERPQDHIDAFAEAGADILTVHAEADPHIHRALQRIRAHGIKAGVAINPSTHESALEPLLDEADLVLCMTVNPGFGGQSLVPAALKKAKRVREMIGFRSIILEADGGINGDTYSEVVQAGVQALVMGTWLLNQKDWAETMAKMRAAI